MMLKANRLYLGDTLIHETGSEAVMSVDRLEGLRLASEYVVVSGNPGMVAGATVAEASLVLSGNVPFVLRDFGTPNGRLEGHFANGEYPTLVFRYQDQKNWIGWTATSSTSIHYFRVRIDGANFDHTFAGPVLVPGDILTVELDAETVRMYRNFVLVQEVKEPRLQTATRHGWGARSTDGDQRSWRDLTWGPGTAFFIKRFFDPATTLLAIDSASSMAELSAAVTSAAAHLNGDVEIHQTPTSDGATVATHANVTFEHANLKPILRALMLAFSRYPTNVLQAQRFTVHIGRDLRFNGVPVNGVAFVTNNLWVNVEPSAVHIAAFGGDVDSALQGLIHHEMAHLMYASMQSAQTALIASFSALGLSYDATIPVNPPPGPRPHGFVREYSRSNINEDQADVFAWLMTPSMRVQFDTWAASDTYLTAKKGIMTEHLKRLGWGLDFFALPHAA